MGWKYAKCSLFFSCKGIFDQKRWQKTVLPDELKKYSLSFRFSLLESYFLHPLCDFPSSFVFPVDLAVIQHMDISPWSSSLQYTGHLSSCPHQESSHPVPFLLLWPFLSQHHAALFSLNFKFPVRVNFEGYKQQNNAELPNQPLSNSSISCLTLAASYAIFMVKTLNKNYTSSVCHLPLHLCCSQHGPYKDFKPPTTPGLTHSRAPADTTPPHNKEWHKMKSRESKPLRAPCKLPPKNFSQLCRFPGTTATVEKDTNPLRCSLLRQGHSCCSHSDTLPSLQALRQRHQDCRRQNKNKKKIYTNRWFK